MQLRKIDQREAETGEEACEGLNFQPVQTLFSFEQRWLKLDRRKGG
jgi:hypothetical protein